MPPLLPAAHAPKVGSEELAAETRAAEPHPRLMPVALGVPRGPAPPRGAQLFLHMPTQHAWPSLGGPSCQQTTISAGFEGDKSSVICCGEAREQFVARPTDGFGRWPRRRAAGRGDVQPAVFGSSAGCSSQCRCSLAAELPA